MAELAPDVFAYGLAAGLSVSAFLATVLLLATDEGMRNALGLLAGVALILAVAAAIAAIATDLVVGVGGEFMLVTLVKLLLGVFLLSLAWRVRPSSEGGPRLEAKLSGMEAKLLQLHPRAAFRVGVGVALLPKRLAITLLAGAAIGAGQPTPGQGLVLLVLYVLTATALIWISLLAVALGGTGARARLEGGRTWAMMHAAALAFAATLLFGALFTGQAIVELLT